MKNTLLLIFAFLLSEFSNVAVSQDFAFCNINNLSGISMREVTAVVRDDDGFVWAASRTRVCGLRLTIISSTRFHLLRLM